MHVKFVCRVNWRQWEWGPAWEPLRDMPGFDGLLWYEYDTTMVSLKFGPLTLRWHFDGARRNERMMESRELVERN